MSWRDFRCKNQHHKESRDSITKEDYNYKDNYKTVDKVKIRIKLIKCKQTRANP